MNVAGRSATMYDAPRFDTPMTTLSYYGDLPISGSAMHARIGDTNMAMRPHGDMAFEPLYASVGESAVDVPPPRVDPGSW